MKQFDPKMHHRKSIRLESCDYSGEGAYFVTVCTHGRAFLFGEVLDGGMRLNRAGLAAAQCWSRIPAHFPQVELDEFVVMPNHIHGILAIVGHARERSNNPKGCGAAKRAKDISPLHSGLRGTTGTIGSIIRGFKVGVTKVLRQNSRIGTVWQRNYYEHIIRDQDSLSRIREYIAYNPLCWETDPENPARSVNHLSASADDADDPWRV